MNLSSKAIGYAEHLHKVISVWILGAEALQVVFAKFASLIQCWCASAVTGDGVAIRYTLENDGVVEGNHATPPVTAFSFKDLANALLMTSSPSCWAM